MRSATVAWFLLGFAVIWGTLFALGLDTPTGIERGLVAAGGTLVVAAAVQRIAFGTSLSAAPYALGLGRPPVRSLLAAAAVSVCLLALYPVYSAATHTTLTLRDGWPWLAVNLFAYHGIAEEVAWRGYAFGRLRRGHSFRRAVASTMPLIAVTHLPVLASAGVLVGSVAILIAAVTCLPLAHLYELGGRTVWPAALVHASIDGFKLFDSPADAPLFPLAIAGWALVVPFLAFAFRTRNVAPRPNGRIAQSADGGYGRLPGSRRKDHTT